MLRMTPLSEVHGDGAIVRLRRARCLVAYWEDGVFVVENYLTQKQTTIAPLVAQLLQTVDTYLSKSAVLERFGAIPCADELVEQLIMQDILVIEGSPLDIKECLIDETWKWKHDVRYFHYSTQHVRYEDDLNAERASLARLAREVPPPSPFKDYGHVDVQLPGAFEKYSGEFWEVLRSRRTKRVFRRQAILLHDFS